MFFSGSSDYLVECPLCKEEEPINDGTGIYECSDCQGDIEITLACPKCEVELQMEEWGQTECPDCGASFDSWKKAQVTASDEESPPKKQSSWVISAIEQAISNVPASKEDESDDPDARAGEIARVAAAKAATSSALAAAAPGPFAWGTILPDLWNVWRIQKQMVSDIAAIYGKKGILTKETMLYCLFRHGGARAITELVIWGGERYIVRRSSLRVIQRILQKIGVKVTQRIAKQLAGRWIPILGSGLLAAFTYRDTIKVAETAMDLFSSDIRFEKPKGGNASGGAVAKRNPLEPKPKAPANKRALLRKN